MLGLYLAEKLVDELGRCQGTPTFTILVDTKFYDPVPEV
jgi:hypothetical protein